MKLDWMMLANYAEANSGLLYVAGGGWDTVTATAPIEGAPPEVFVVLNGALVIRILFHTTETNRDHTFTVTIIDEDGGELGKIEGGFPLAKAPGYPPSWDQPVNIPVPLNGIALPRAGLYRFSLQVDGQHAGERPFRVIKGF